MELAEPDWGQGGGHLVEALPGLGCGHGGRQGRAGDESLGQGGEATGATVVAGRSAAVVVVDAAVVGGVSGAGRDSASAPGRAESSPGGAGMSLPDIVATDNAVCGAGSACDTAITASTIVTLVSATNSARGVNRRIQLRCTDPTSIASRPEARTPAGADPSR